MEDPKGRWGERRRKPAFLPHPSSKCAKDRPPSDHMAKNPMLTSPQGRQRKGKETPKYRWLPAFLSWSRKLESRPVAHNLSFCASCTHPEMQGEGRWPLPPRGGTGVSSQGQRRNLARRATRTMVYPRSRPLLWEAPLEVRRRLRREQEPGQNLLRAGQAAPEGTLASGPSLGEWVTLYILCFAGNGDEKTVVVCYPLEIPQRPGILRTCPASQIGNGQR